ncbi:DNA translocase FtsK [Patescibacteria group bacterium]|nr:DNA translocase FtsK [Patescibacteria group bacterium]MBU0776773.1 DNA translocase FtsK [Patescibacteria group bacterium]MBU0846346.1 DNA translocase FtsK [Patescibacteria group bacterium]MBU0922694.1 DNA translocase FtsK [Patescibacteria group bacterium]MBU1066745.1 DNA translocase FtsK [Patescibacteria group bacterium]
MAKRKHKKRAKSSFKLKLKKGTIHSIGQIFFFSLAGLIIVSFARQGVVLVKLNDFLVSYLSWTTIFLPFVLLSAGFLLTKFKIPFAQANVLVGSLLFFISTLTITRAGILGKFSWDGVATLITSVGAFIVLLGTGIIGLIILFNTSVDQVVTFFGVLLAQIRRYLVGDKAIRRAESLAKRKLKVSGSQATSTASARTPGRDAAQEVLEPKLVSNIPGENKVWKHPSLNILSETQIGKADRGDIKGNAHIIEQTLESFGITARVVEVNLGPAVTQYALEVALGTKLSKITSLERDLALALAAPTGTIRIEAPIPGRSLVGIELPNRSPEFVPLKKMLQADSMREANSKLTLALGLDVSGKSLVADLALMPHILIAGQTGSGKSVCINTFLSTLLFRAAPSEVKLIMVDPKRVELTGYNGIPHLLSPVIVDPKKVISALRWVLSEMDRRYKLFAQAGVRNMTTYNEMSGFQALPHIVVVIDELADIMLFSPVEVEDAITRIAQMSRATGIHMILSTQRPSVDVITGLIKANIPCRIAFAVSSQVDSRVILDMQGAEKLLGKGDMLYLPPDQAKPIRIQGAFVSDKETTDLVSFLKNQGVEPQYTEEVVSMPKPGTTVIPGVDEELDELFKSAVEVICQYDRASASLLQRRLSIGYARAARIIDQLEAAGAIGPAEGSKPRDVLIQSPEEFLSAPPPGGQPAT